MQFARVPLGPPLLPAAPVASLSLAAPARHRTCIQRAEALCAVPQRSVRGLRGNLWGDPHTRGPL